MSFNLSSFDTGLYNLSADNPAPINVPTANLVGGAFTRGGEFSLSAANNSVQVLNTGTIGSSLVIGVLFNYISDATSAPAAARTLRSPDHATHNTHIRLHSDYHGQTFALVAANGMTVTYVGAASTMVPYASGFNLVVGPNMRRKSLLGYI